MRMQTHKLFSQIYDSEYFIKKKAASLMVFLSFWGKQYSHF